MTSHYLVSLVNLDSCEIVKNEPITQNNHFKSNEKQKTKKNVNLYSQVEDWVTSSERGMGPTPKVPVAEYNFAERSVEYHSTSTVMFVGWSVF